MTRTNLLPVHSGDTYTIDEAKEAIGAWLLQQQQVGRQGMRLIGVSFDPQRRITSVQVCDRPQKFERLPKHS